eukprot:2128102-Pyramimonas_sp.AAC.1
MSVSSPSVMRAMRWCLLGRIALAASFSFFWLFSTFSSGCFYQARHARRALLVRVVKKWCRSVTGTRNA